jgi:hypothetical protein
MNKKSENVDDLLEDIEQQKRKKGLQRRKSKGSLSLLRRSDSMVSNNDD